MVRMGSARINNIQPITAFTKLLNQGNWWNTLVTDEAQSHVGPCAHVFVLFERNVSVWIEWLSGIIPKCAVNNVDLDNTVRFIYTHSTYIYLQFINIHWKAFQFLFNLIWEWARFEITVKIWLNFTHIEPTTHKIRFENGVVLWYTL